MGSLFRYRQGKAARGQDCGEAGNLVAPEVKAGDTVLFGKYSSEVKLDGEEHMIMRGEDLLGVIEG